MAKPSNKSNPSGVMRIAVIADTHGKLPEKVVSCLREADEIWHLGDFCNLATLNACVDIGRPFYAVQGNNDFGLDLPEFLLLERGGHQFYLIHIEPRRHPACDFLLHGHTHVPRDETVGGTRFLNPGTLGKPNKGVPPAWAWLEIDTKGNVTWRLNPV
jgi:putative phosphoesterase